MELSFACIVEVPLDWHCWPHQFSGIDVQMASGLMYSLNYGCTDCSMCQFHCTAASAASLTISLVSGPDPIIQVIILD